MNDPVRAIRMSAKCTSATASLTFCCLFKNRRAHRIQTEPSLAPRSETIRLAASFPSAGVAGAGSNDVAAGAGELIGFTPLTIPGAATYGIHAAIAATANA